MALIKMADDFFIALAPLKSVAATQIGSEPLKAVADLYESYHWHGVPLEAQRANFALPLVELPCGTIQPSAQTLFGVEGAPCNPLPLSRTPQLSASSVRG
jgi:hypothetical protein